MTKFRDLPVGAYFTFFDNSDGTLCVKVSKTSSYNSYGTYRFADYRNPMPYLIADWFEVTPDARRPSMFAKPSWSTWKISRTCIWPKLRWNVSAPARCRPSP